MGFGDGIPITREQLRFTGRVDIDEQGQDRVVIFLVSARIGEGQIKMLPGDIGEQSICYVAKVEDAVPLSGSLRDQAIVYLAHGGDQGAVDFPNPTYSGPEPEPEPAPEETDLSVLTSSELMALVREGGELADDAEEELLARTAGESQTDVGDGEEAVHPEGEDMKAPLHSAAKPQVSEGGDGAPPEGVDPEAGEVSQTDVGKPDPEAEAALAELLEEMGEEDEDDEEVFIPPEAHFDAGQPHLNDYKQGRKGRERANVKRVSLDDLERIQTPAGPSTAPLEGTFHPT